MRLYKPNLYLHYEEKRDNLLYLTNEDKEMINSSYKSFLLNLKYLLSSQTDKNALECAKIIINMLQKGMFSTGRKVHFDNDFKYLYLPNMNSDGVQVLHGICCCRHASALLNDILQILDFKSTLLYIFIDKNNDWHISKTTNANHVTVLLKDKDSEYILDPINKFILKKESNKNIILLDLDVCNDFEEYQDSNIQSIGKVLNKYYNLQNLGINYIYE